MSLVLPRTVYTENQIRMMAERAAVLSIRFRQCLMPIKPAIGMKELRDARLINGTPQSITKMMEGSTDWIYRRLTK